MSPAPRENPQPPSGVTDLRGASRLATDATLGLTALVEAMHARIASLPGLQGPEQTRGITGLVYKSIRGVTRLVGGSVDGLLGVLTPWLKTPLSGAAGPAGAATLPSREREAIVAALNGVLGDHLAATANPLATPMTLRHAGRALTLEPTALTESLQAALPPPTLASGRLLVLLHGLCMNDLQWQREGHDHGASLAAALGYTPVYLHYNSGLAVHANGAAFAQLLPQLLAAWPQPLQRVALLGHSMGGLVARSALHQATVAGQVWPQHVHDLICLGTPHHGAPLERAGHWVDLLLGAAPYAAPLARLGRVRSAGITSLRHGQLLPGPATAQPVHVPLPVQPRCYAVAASTGPASGALKGRQTGDGLVPLDSALGRHKDPARTLHFEPDRQVQLHGLNHLQLLSRPEVLEPLLRWLR